MKCETFLRDGMSKENVCITISVPHDHQQQEGRLLQGVLNAQTAEDMNIVRVIFGGQPVYSSWNGHQVMASLENWRCASHVTVLCHGQKLDQTYGAFHQWGYRKNDG